MAVCTIVNTRDELLGYKASAELQPGDIYRISALWIFNEQGEILLAQRAATKRNDPGKWGPSVAGTVEPDEDYESNIYKEAAEEIGLEDQRFILGPKAYVADNGYGHGYFCQAFLLKLSRPASTFVLESAEVAQVRWWPVDELKQALEQKPEDFTVQFAQRMGAALIDAAALLN